MSTAEPSNEITGNALIPVYENDPMKFFESQHETSSGQMSSNDEPQWALNEVRLSEEVDVTETSKISRWRGRIFGGALIAATGAALLFEQSPANESVRATAAFNVLEDTEDEFVAGALTVAGLTMVIEGVTSTLIAAGLNRNSNVFSRRLNKFRDAVDGKDDTNDSENKKSLADKLTDTGITCTLGPGMVVFRRHFQEEDRTFMKDMKTATGYCAVGSVVSGGIGYLAVGGVAHADKVGLGTPAEYFVDYATDWKFWTGLLAVGYGIKYTKSGMSKLKQRLYRDNDDVETVI